MVAFTTGWSWSPPRTVADSTVVVKGFSVILIRNIFLSSSSPSSSSTLSLSTSPSLSKTSIDTLLSSSFLHQIHSNFFLKSSNSFLFLHFIHKFFIFPSNLHPNFLSTPDFFHPQFPPFSPQILHFLLQNLHFYFHFPFLPINFSKFFIVRFSLTPHSHGTKEQD